jgi:hypothetical protein
MITHLHLVARLRMRAAVPPLSHTPSWYSAGLSTEKCLHFNEILMQLLR